MSAYKWVLHCKTIKTGSIYHGFDTPTQPPGAASGGIGNRFPYMGGMDTPILRKNAFRPADRDERRDNIFRGTTLIPGQAGHSLNAGNGASPRLRLLGKAVQRRCSQGNFASCLFGRLAAKGRLL